MSQPTVLTQVLSSPKSVSAPCPPQPMPFRVSVLLFGLPGLIIALSIYLFLPRLNSLGISQFESYLVAHLVPMTLLFAAALVALYKVEAYPLTWASLSQRYRYPPFGGKDVLWGLGVFAAIFLLGGLASQLEAGLIASHLLPLPVGLSRFMDPRTPLLSQVAGGSFRGHWEIAALYFVMLFFNIAGEELWWRGYIFPRQELRHGRFAWLVHGLMWTLFHAFKYWDMISLLPVCLIIAYSAQKLKSNWPAFIAHYLYNGLGFAIVLAAVVGVL